MFRESPLASGRIVTLAIACGALACPKFVEAAPVFYLSTQIAGATPGLLDLTGPSAVAPNSTGTLHIWADSDIRLVGASLDLLETGGAIKFTGLNVPNPNNRWMFFDGPQVITNSAVINIGGAAIPGIEGNGIGQGSPEGDSVLIASVDYMTLNTGTSQLSLRVGNNGIAEWIGPPFTEPFPQLRFGAEDAPLVSGDPSPSQASGSVGAIAIAIGPALPVLVDESRPTFPGDLFRYTFRTVNPSTPAANLTWSDFTFEGVGIAIEPTFDPLTQLISWNTAGSQQGVFTARVKITDSLGNSDIGTLRIILDDTFVPEPTTATLLSMAWAGFVGSHRCRSDNRRMSTLRIVVGRKRSIECRA